MIDAVQPLIQITDMTKVFYTDEIETHELSGVHLSINKGEYVAMSGPSGCGKSTLLSIIGLLDTPTAGRYFLNAKPVENLTFAERARIRNQEIGLIFQSFNLIGDLTVYENVELPLTYRQRMPSGERKARVMEALERVGMAHRVRHYPSQLSGGQQQRVAVARALGGKPSILLADEPTGNLDSRNGEAVMELLAESAQRGRDDLHGHPRSTVCETRTTRSPSVRRQSGSGRGTEKADGRCAGMNGFSGPTLRRWQLRKSPDSLRWRYLLWPWAWERTPPFSGCLIRRCCALCR